LWTLIRNLVELLARAGRARDAVSLHGAAAVSSTASPAFGEQGARLADLMKQLEREIGSHAFVEAIQRGESMTDEEAVEFVRTAIAQAAATTGTHTLTAPTAPR